MPTIEQPDASRLPAAPAAPPGPARAGGRLLRLTRSLSGKLIALLLLALVTIFAVLGYVNIRLHRKHLEAATLLSAERVSDMIKRSTSYYMLRDDREGLYHTIATMAAEPGVARIRIINPEGRITYSTDSKEVNSFVDKKAEACYHCHAQAQPLSHLDRPDRFRIFRPNGHRVLGIINPIENRPACANAACHAHPAGQKILGVLDATLSLERADASLAESTHLMLAYTALALVVVALLAAWFVLRVVDRPIKALTAGTGRLAGGELGYQIQFSSADELGDLALSFNDMSRQLLEARDEVTAWARTLEARVEQKSRELKRAHEAVVQSEKMASIGKMAAVVAHEINNPLSGILTYSKLIRRWLAQQPPTTRRDEMLRSLELIESESRRCGEIVKNLLTFARTTPMNLEWADINKVVDQVVRLVAHQLELNAIQLHRDLAEPPAIHCDPAQIEQLLLALVINAVEAMPRGGNLWLRSSVSPARDSIQLEVRDDGVGISQEFLPHVFEPFRSTKEGGSSAGLGLAVSRSIVERHHGRIDVVSQVGRGTTFTVVLPVGESMAAAAPEAAAAAR